MWENSLKMKGDLWTHQLDEISQLGLAGRRKGLMKIRKHHKEEQRYLVALRVTGDIALSAGMMGKGTQNCRDLMAS